MWRDVVDHALDHETRKHEQEQLEWIARDPLCAQPFYNLAQLRRMQYKRDEGLALLLEAVRLDPKHAESHTALAEIRAVAGDYRAAWRHARAARDSGSAAAVDLLARHGIPESD